MIQLQRTKNLDLVRSLMTHPRIYPYIIGENPVDAKDFRPNPDPSIHYMVAYEHEVMGVFITHPLNPVCWEMHHAILPKFWGAPVDAIGDAFERWILTETPCQVAVGFTPEHNRLAVRYARRRNMRETGRIPNGSRKDGKLYDVIVFTKTKEQSTLI